MATATLSANGVSVKKPLIAVIYARFSPRSRPDRCQSCDIQIADLRRYCEAMGYQVREHLIFRDDALSGRSAAGRKGLQAALVACRRGMVFVCRDTARLARSMVHSFQILSDMARRGVMFETIVDGRYDHRDPNKIAVFGIKAVMNEIQRIESSHATRVKVRRYQAEKRRMSNILPFGMMLDPADPARLLDCPEEQAALRRLLELHRDGLDGVRLSERALARQMEAEGYEFRGKSAWNHTTVRKILRREREREREPS